MSDLLITNVDVLTNEGVLKNHAIEIENWTNDYSYFKGYVKLLRLKIMLRKCSMVKANWQRQVS